MPLHDFTPTRFYNSIGSHAPALTVGDGDTVVTQTLDAHGFDRHGERRADGPNPMTGPFFVSGAEPGDALLIRIERITLTRATGWTHGSRRSLSRWSTATAPTMRLPPRWPRPPKSRCCRRF